MEMLGGHVADKWQLRARTDEARFVMTDSDLQTGQGVSLVTGHECARLPWSLGLQLIRRSCRDFWLLSDGDSWR